MLFTLHGDNTACKILTLTDLWCVKDLSDLHHIGDVPGVLSERPQGQGVLPDKAGREVRQPFLLAARRDSLL